MSDSGFAIGDEVEHVESHTVGILTDVNPDQKDGEYFAEMQIGSYTKIIDEPEDIELVRSAKDVPPKAVPTMDELRSFLGMTLLDDNEGIEVDETEREGDDAVLIYGMSETGQRFGARITIDNIERTDF